MSIHGPIHELPTRCHWTKSVTADGGQTMQTGGLEPTLRDVFTDADTKITIKTSLKTSVPLLLPAQGGQHPPAPGEHSSGERIKDSNKVQTLW